MKHYFLLLTALVFAFQLHAQKLKKVVVKHKNPYYTETFYVLKNNPGVRNGTYLKEQAGRIVEKGQYEDNQRTGQWEYFYFGKPSKTGTFLNGKKTGVWKFYDFSGELAQTYDYSNSQLIYQQELTGNTTYFVMKDGQFQESTLDVQPVPIGGFEKLYRALDYPSQARRAGTQGQVIVAVTISKTG